MTRTEVFESAYYRPGNHAKVWHNAQFWSLFLLTINCMYLTYISKVQVNKALNIFYGIPLFH